MKPLITLARAAFVRQGAPGCAVMLAACLSMAGCAGAKPGLHASDAPGASSQDDVAIAGEPAGSPPAETTRQATALEAGGSATDTDATASANLPVSQALQGQLSIKLKAFGATPAKGLSLGFFFTGHAQAGQLDLITLMGSQFAQVDWAADGVWLTDDKGRHRYASMAELSAAALGEALPLQALVHWMQGKPDPAWPSTPGPDAKPQSFTQLGWTIDLSELSIRKLTATRPGTASQRGVFVKVYLDR